MGLRCQPLPAPPRCVLGSRPGGLTSRQSGSQALLAENPIKTPCLCPGLGVTGVRPSSGGIGFASFGGGGHVPGTTAVVTGLSCCL